MTPIRLLIFILGLLLVFDSSGQDLANTHYKYKVIAEVLNKVAKAKGDNRAVPQLIVRKTQKDIAVFFPGGSANTILVEEKVYDICTTLGKDSLNALACVIGHELGHYYENHAGGFGYADKYSKDLSVSQRLELERQADKFGLFYGMIAGYDTYHILPIILTKIYDRYGKGDIISGYPSKNDRVAVAKEALFNNQQLGTVYDAGQWLYAIQAYDFAEQCFRYLLNHFPSKETHNNLGVIYLQKSVAKHKIEENYFAYPFEFDIKNRLLKSLDTTQIMTRSLGEKEYIAKAIRHFEEAIRLDEFYETAYINLSGAYSLDGNQESAAGKITELEKKLQLKKRSLPPNGYLVRGISRALGGNYLSAKRDLEQAALLRGYRVDYNMEVFSKIYGGADSYSYVNTFVSWLYSFIEDEAITPANPTRSFGKEVINDRLPSSVKATQISTSVDIGNWMELKYHRDLTSTFYHLRSLRYPSQQLNLLLTPKEYSGVSNRGIHQGSIADEVDKKYGNPDYIAATSSGEAAVYSKGKIAFLISGEKVVKWAVWHDKQ